MTVNRTDWSDLREFKNVDLTRSFILSWEDEGGSLQADVDLFLCPEHAFYEKPRPAEKACFRPACIEFPWCTAAHLEGEGSHSSYPHSLKDLRSGQIRAFARIGEGQYEISGDFGYVRVESGRPMVRLK